MILLEELNQYYSRNVVMDKYAETLVTYRIKNCCELVFSRFPQQLRTQDSDLEQRL